jgi:hypothetical protein
MLPRRMTIDAARFSGLSACYYSISIGLHEVRVFRANSCGAVLLQTSSMLGELCKSVERAVSM